MKLLVCTLCLAMASIACERDPGQPNREYMPDMVSSIAYEAFSTNTIAKDGRTMMAPPAGTVAQNQDLFAYAAGPDEALRAGREIDNPLAESDLVHQRGAIAFARWCSPCHGALGQGDGPITRLFPRPPSLAADHAQEMADGQIFHVITHGQGVMHGYAQQVEARDRWMIVHHIRKLQYDAQMQALQAAPAAAPPTDNVPASPADPSAPVTP